MNSLPIILNAVYKTDLSVEKNIFNKSLIDFYSTKIDDEKILFGVSESQEFYPCKCNKYLLFWNLSSNSNKHLLDLYLLLKSLYNIEKDWSKSLQDDMKRLECYSDLCDLDSSCYNRLRMVFRFLLQKRILKEYAIQPNITGQLWNDCICKNSICLYTLNLCEFKRAVKQENQAWSLKQEILLLLESDHICLDCNYYFLTDDKRKPYLSFEPGKFGGHKKLHIYGRLNCPSALRFLAKSQYKKNRIFFADRETAIAAGFRPCSVCLKEEYSEWKSNNS